MTGKLTITAAHFTQRERLDVMATKCKVVIPTADLLNLLRPMLKNHDPNFATGEVEVEPITQNYGEDFIGVAFTVLVNVTKPQEPQ